MAFYFKNTKKDIIMTEENEEDFENNIILDFAKKKFCLIKNVITVT